MLEKILQSKISSQKKWDELGKQEQLPQKISVAI